MIRRLLKQRKSTAYYAALILGIGLAVGVGTLAVTGQGLLTADPDLALALHESPLIESASHDHTLLGDVLLGKEAQAHPYRYCGNSTRWVTIDGVLHKIVHIKYFSNGDNYVKRAHYMWTGTGYTRVTNWAYRRIDC